MGGERRGEVLVRASSRSSSSEFGAWRSETRFRCGYSRPITGVTSMCSYWSREPVLFTHGFAAAALPGWIAAVTWAGSLAEGAMIAEMLSLGLWLLSWVGGYEGV